MIIDWILNKFKKFTIEDFNLDEKAEIRFVKNIYGRYHVQWWHPLYQTWWTLPGGLAGIHARWTLLNHGSFGAYDLEKYELNFPEIRINTIGDVKKYLKRFEDDYEEFQRRKKIDNEKPLVIYKN